MASTKPIRLGVIGLSASPGGWAPTLLHDILPPAPLSARYTITALCTSSPASAAAATEKYSSLYGDSVTGYHGARGAQDIAADPDVDMVVVAVKVGQHKASVLPALERGKDVFVEWPLGKGYEEAVEIAALAKKKGVRTMVGAQGPQSPAVRKLAEVVKSGSIGRVLSSTVIGNAPSQLKYWGPIIGARAAYTADADGGASFLDIAVGHFLTYFTDVLGDIVAVSATLECQYPTAALVSPSGEPTGETTSQTGANQVAFTATLRSGAVASFHFRAGLNASNPGQTPFFWLIDGENGSIRLESAELNGSFVHVAHPRVFIKGEEWKPEGDLNIYTNPGSAWNEFAKGPEGHYSTFDDAVRVQRILHTIRRSADEGRRIMLRDEDSSQA